MHRTYWAHSSSSHVQFFCRGNERLTFITVRTLRRNGILYFNEVRRTHMILLHYRKLVELLDSTNHCFNRFVCIDVGQHIWKEQNYKKDYTSQSFWTKQTEALLITFDQIIKKWILNINLWCTQHCTTYLLQYIALPWIVYFHKSIAPGTRSTEYEHMAVCHL